MCGAFDTPRGGLWRVAGWRRRVDVAWAWACARVLTRAVLMLTVLVPANIVY